MAGQQAQPSGIAPIDPRAWLLQRGWIEFTDFGPEPYYRKTPNEPGWRGGSNLSGAVHMELQAFTDSMLKAMGLYRPPTRSRRCC